MIGEVEFLYARIGEDEALAREAEPFVPPGAVIDITLQGPTIGDTYTVKRIHPWHPVQALAECEAKRAIIAEHMPYVDYIGHALADDTRGYDPTTCSTCDAGREEHLPFPCPTLRAVAVPCLSHPSCPASLQ